MQVLSNLHYLKFFYTSVSLFAAKNKISTSKKDILVY